MKKQLYLPCTIWRPILVSLPLALLLAVSVRMNPEVDTPGKLYPLIAFSILAIIFTFVYFFRVVTISKDEIKIIGPFSSKDSSLINEGKTLIITQRSLNRISVDLFGNNGVNADLDWLKNEEKVRDIYLFKSDIVGGKNTIAKILLYFDINRDDANLFISSNAAFKEYQDYTVSASQAEDAKEIRIKFTNTI